MSGSTQDYLKDYKELDDQYSQWKSIHRDIAEYIMLGYGSFPQDGDPNSATNVSRPQKVLNDAATRAVRILGAGLQGGLCSPSRPWFRLKMEDDELTKYGPVKTWLHDVEKIMYKWYAGSNFYGQIHSTFECEGGFGVAPMIQEENHGGDSPIKFRMFDPGSYRLALGGDGTVDICMRHLRMSVKQLADQFGEAALTPACKAKLNKDGQKYGYQEVYHILRPRKDRDQTKIDSLNMPYESIWFEDGAPPDKFLEKGGFEEKPFVAPRWLAPGMSAYGTSPGHTTIGTTKMLQEYEKSGIIALHKEINPPLDVPSSYKGVISLLPGALNYRADGTKEAISSILNVKANLPGLNEKIANTMVLIERAFFNHLFMMILNADYSGREMTATEILKRNEEKLLLLGPTLERQFSELLDPTIDRTFAIGLKRGLFPPPPQEVLEQNWDVEYISVLAQAQRMADAQNMQVYRMEAMDVAQLDPDSIAKTNYDRYLDEFADVVGMPPDILRPQEEVDAIREQAQKQVAEMAQQEQMAGAASMAKDLGAANTQSGSALGDLIDESRGVS